MTKDSLRKLLNKFPYFLDKRDTSNFYKSQDVTNRQFQGMMNDLFKVYQSFHLDKRLLIWRVQNEPYKYMINFVANYPHLKSVSLYKNDKLIYTEQYNIEDNVNSFIYSYEGNTENNGLEDSINLIIDEIQETELQIDSDMEDDESETGNATEIPDDYIIPIIPTDTFRMDVETYDEYSLSKGYPENDIAQNNIYDHDYSLDRIGALNNIPRKTYLLVDETLYPSTEPPFNNKTTEDDYYYMNRIINYNLRLHNTPLPVLEIWKLYGVDATMLNRERLLLKMFDEEKHPFDKETGLVKCWQPKPWEHKDKFCSKTEDLGQYFIVMPITTRPSKWEDLTFYFKVLNNLAETLEHNYLIDIYLTTPNNVKTLLKSNLKDTFYKVSYDELDEENINTFEFILKSSDGEVITTDTTLIKVKGCNDADWYVSSTGNDANKGTKEEPFLTMNNALGKVTEAANLIVVQGNVSEDNIPLIERPCTILGCGDAVLTSTESNKLFNVSPKNDLKIIDLTLKYGGATSYIKSHDFINNSPNNNVYVIINGGEATLTLNLDKQNYYPYDHIYVSGTLTNNEDIGVENTELKLYFNDNLMHTFTTNSQGEYGDWISINEEQGIHIITISLDVPEFLKNDETLNINLTKNPTSMNVSLGNEIQLVSTGNAANSNVNFYDSDGSVIGTVAANSSGVATLTWEPSWGTYIIYTIGSNGHSINQEWIIETQLTIQSLPTNTLITDISIDVNTGNLSITSTQLSEITTLNQLNGALLDVYVEGEEIKVKRFESVITDERLYEDYLYPEDLEVLSQAITSIAMTNDAKLKCERIGEIIF